MIRLHRNSFRIWTCLAVALIGLVALSIFLASRSDSSKEPEVAKVSLAQLFELSRSEDDETAIELLMDCKGKVDLDCDILRLTEKDFLSLSRDDQTDAQEAMIKFVEDWKGLCFKLSSKAEIASQQGDEAQVNEIVAILEELDRELSSKETLLVISQMGEFMASLADEIKHGSSR